MTRHAEGLFQNTPTPLQLSELFLQISSGRVTRSKLQAFLGGTKLLDFVGGRHIKGTDSFKPKLFFQRKEKPGYDRLAVLPAERIFDTGKEFEEKMLKGSVRRVCESYVVSSALKTNATSLEILTEFDGLAFQLSLWHMAEILQCQLKGECDLLDTNGLNNLCFIGPGNRSSITGVVITRFQLPKRKWRVDFLALPSCDDKKWNRGTRVLNT